MVHELVGLEAGNLLDLRSVNRLQFSSINVFRPEIVQCEAEKQTGIDSRVFTEGTT